MSLTSDLDQPGPEEARWDEFARELDEFRARTVSMADEFSLATPQLREEGQPLPLNWARQYVNWTERRNQLATELSSRLGTGSVSEQSFSEWSKSIHDRRDVLRAEREQEAAEIRSVMRILQRVQGSTSTDSQLNSSPEIEQARTLATILIERINDPETRAVVMQDSGTRKGLESMLLLIDGTNDSEKEEQAVSDVEVMFGRKLSIALLRGRISAPQID